VECSKLRNDSFISHEGGRNEGLEQDNETTKRGSDQEVVISSREEKVKESDDRGVWCGTTDTQAAVVFSVMGISIIFVKAFLWSFCV